MKATKFLKKARKLLQKRGKQYDSEGGERSITKTVEIFNVLTGHNLTEVDGWVFMMQLKQARSRQGGLKSDTYEDMAAYAALAGEAAARVKRSRE